MGVLTQEYLKECMRYEPESGVFTWRERPIGHFAATKKRTAEHNCKRWNAIWSSKSAGYNSTRGYVQICIDYKRCLAHRLASLYMSGSMPANEVDHINGEPSDNRWCNLREVTAKENHKNRKKPKHNTSGIIGVIWSKISSEWYSYIQVNKKSINLGSYADFFEAVCARKLAENKYGFHYNHGRAL